MGRPRGEHLTLRRLLRERTTLAASLALVAIATAGCVATESPPPPRGVVVNGPPPAPMAETPPSPPEPHAVWVAGYWHWAGTQYVWIPGHWEKAPFGRQWQAPRYSVVNGAYVYQPGLWLVQQAAAPRLEPNVRSLR